MITGKLALQTQLCVQEIVTQKLCSAAYHEPQACLGCQLLLRCCLLRFEDLQDDMETVDTAELEQQRVSFMPEAVPCAGVHHIVHNLSKNVCESLTYWPVWHEGFQTLCSLLYKPEHRERFTRTCIHGTVHSGHLEAFTQGFSKPHWEKRWASIVETCRKLSSLFYIFRSAWSEEKFLSAEIHGKTRDIEVNPGAVTKVVADATWWAYLQAMFELQLCLHSLSQWCDGCSCHEHVLVDHSRFRREHSLRRLCSKGTCPLKGKRAPEMAAGQLERVLFQLEQASLVHLAVERPGVSEEGWNTITSDFHKACSFIQTGLRTKLLCWEHLPWKLAGLAHYNVDSARSCGLRALQLWQAVPDHAKDSHEPFVKKFMANHYEELKDFVAGTDLTNLSLLFQESVATFRVWVISERVIEASFSLVIFQRTR